MLQDDHMWQDADPEIALLAGLVAIPSLSREEATAAHWLVEQMRGLGYTRAFVDGAGNAVGELGHADAGHTVVLLGHIDTVPGYIPVRIDNAADGPKLYGRGSVDAKGPLAAFVWAAGLLGHEWCVAHDARLVVVGAVEEEAATSKGARFIADRFNGMPEARPRACIIGEPSGWRRVTLGYKGRLLIDVCAVQPMAHSAGPDAGVATVPVAIWNWIATRCAEFNAGRSKAFDQLLPSLRSFQTGTDETMHDWARSQMGIRLPEDFDAPGFVAQLVEQARTVLGAVDTEPHSNNAQHDDAQHATNADAFRGPGQQEIRLASASTQLMLRLRGYEPAWRSDRQNELVRSFLFAIRSLDVDGRPGFVVKTGTSDMNVVGPVWQCPILAYGPGDSALDHTPNEHIDLDEFRKSTQVLALALRNLLGS